MADATFHCNLKDLESVVGVTVEGVVEDLREVLTDGLTFIQTKLVEEAPRQAGDFATSIRPYLGEPGPTWARDAGTADAGAAEVEDVMREWKPGDEVGTATDAPYSRKLMLHAGERTGGTRSRGRRRKRTRYTTKVKAGWVDLIVEEGNRRMEGGG